MFYNDSASITIITDAFPVIWDLHLMNDYAGKIVFGPLALPLLQYNKNNNIFENVACEEYILSNGGHEHTFVIKSCFKWTNGDPVAAEDYCRAFEKIIKSKTPLSFLLRNVQGFNASSKETCCTGITFSNNKLTFKLTKPDHDFSKLMSIVNFSPINNQLNPQVSAGPFVFHKKNDAQIVYKRNSFYDSGDTSVPDIVFHKESDRYKGLELYKSDKADITCNTMFPFECINNYSKKSEFHSSPLNIVGCLVFNEKSSNVHSMNLRVGLTKLINREMIKKELLDGVSIANDFFVHSQNDIGGTDALFDPDEGDKLIGKYFNERRIRNSSIKCTYDDFYPNLIIVKNIYNQLKKFGINLKVIKDDYYKPNRLEYDMKFVLSPLLYESDLANYPLMGFSTFLRQEIDVFRKYYSLLSSYASIKNQIEKKKIAENINDILLRNGIAIPIIKLNNLYLKKSDVKGFSYCNNESDFRHIRRI